MTARAKYVPGFRKWEESVSRSDTAKTVSLLFDVLAIMTTLMVASLLVIKATDKPAGYVRSAEHQEMLDKMRHRQEVPRGRPSAHPTFCPSFDTRKANTDPDAVNTHGLPITSRPELPDNGALPYPFQHNETLVQDDFVELRAANGALKCRLLRTMRAHGPHDDFTHEAAKLKRLQLLRTGLLQAERFSEYSGRGDDNGVSDDDYTDDGKHVYYSASARFADEETGEEVWERVYAIGRQYRSRPGHGNRYDCEEEAVTQLMAKIEIIALAEGHYKSVECTPHSFEEPSRSRSVYLESLRLHGGSSGTRPVTPVVHTDLHDDPRQYHEARGVDGVGPDGTEQRANLRTTRSGTPVREGTHFNYDEYRMRWVYGERRYDEHREK